LWWGDLSIEDNFEDLGVDRITTLKWIFKKWAWIGLLWL
jgi:hypothetical protein